MDRPNSPLQSSTPLLSASPSGSSSGGGFRSLLQDFLRFSAGACRRVQKIIRDPNNRLRLLYALTFVLIIVVALIAPRVFVVLALIGLLIAFLCAVSEHYAPPSTLRPDKFWPIPGEPAPHAVFSYTQPSPMKGVYPGAVELADDYDEARGDAPDSFLQWGHRDRMELDAPNAPEGNPFAYGKIATPAAASPCIDDEANDAEMDADELNTYQARSRNDQTRVDAGTMRRRRDLDKYLREEVDQYEDQWWWGRHEV